MNKYPYTDFHELNLDYIMEEQKKTVKTVNGNVPDQDGNVEVAAVPQDLHQLKFTGAVSAEYDGSQEVTVDIPQGGSVTVDSQLSTTSTNPVQNRVVTQAINNKADKTTASQSNDGLMSAQDKFELDMAVEEIANGIPNPNALTFTGAVTGSYDGSAPVTINVPSGGGGVWELIKSVTTDADVGQIVINSDSLGHSFELTDIVIVGRLRGNSINSSGWTNISLTDISGHTVDIGSAFMPYAFPIVTGDDNYWSFVTHINTEPYLRGIGFRSTNNSSAKYSLKTVGAYDNIVDPYTFNGNVISIRYYSYQDCIGAGSEIYVYGKRA